ncbi:LacI family DNA-binding transcriptional regulator [Herbaspirillum sp. LeCh32-8]|uniref:LacI family DNA-binding transcriptional regulator n=1 Tax=Herbaspirillum sp. LeCh32-8 TaxID=2821356 RepID=UPI001AE1083E|nr:LacI family DNA-binding transcriptional regulator [Herbaspirillum sp. LeCh32-8]MBP0597840.1 LacI family DNA-binding transcriptional regulator [Herbaspirillum sp. LeCh32-8]
MTDTTKNSSKNAARSRRGTNRVTMDDVAARARVSASSVSLFLRNPEAVSARIAPRIKRAIEVLGYVPNKLAGSLAAARTRAIGVVVPALGNAFFAETVAAMQSEFDRHGYQLLLGASEYDLEREAELVRAFLSWSPTALVVTGCHHNEATHTLLRQANVPVVEMWETGEQPFDLQVGFSHRAVGEALAAHLHGLGARRIAFIGARMEKDMRAGQRRDGFCDWFKARGIDALAINQPVEASPTAGGAALNAALDAMPDLQAVACSNDVMALGVLFEAQRLGIAVPDRLAVTGFGDLPFSQACVPSLTTIEPRASVIGLRIAQELLARLDAEAQGEDAPEPKVVDVAFELMVRDSSRRGPAD